ncbi:transcription-repair coupling factor [Candidatus Solincola tengchongensis]|uniref:transcription-repair coupling factor n=1 Tax=Candidatus Solincola tengchongensis TaxID=2900693 RepID=UPI00257AE82A|nr:transcription-repair coupling factor [Candidatus Solincola tengchongensis]
MRDMGKGEELLEFIRGEVEASLDGELPEAVPGRGRLVIRATEEAHPFLVAYLFRLFPGTLLVAVPGTREVEEMVEGLRLMLFPGEVMELPFRELVIAGKRGEDPEAVSLRARALAALREGRHAVVCCEALALAHPVPAGELSALPVRLREGEEADRDGVLERLADMGYVREYLVEGGGQFAVRGGILDVYDPALQAPVRVEWFGDRVERIRFFDPLDQRSREGLREVEFFPVRPGPGEPRRLGELLGPGCALVLLQPYLLRRCWRDAEEAAEPDLEDIANRTALVELDPLAGASHLQLRSRAAGDFGGRVGEFLRELKETVEEGFRVVVLLETEGRLQRMREAALEEGIPVVDGGLPSPGTVRLAALSWGRGLVLPDRGLALFTDGDVFGRRRVRVAAGERGAGRPLEGWWELEEGDFVVHVNHGIAVYGGLVRREVEGTVREYLLLKYAGGDALYVPVDRIDLVHRYVGAEKPEVHRLSGHHWRKVKRRARASAREMALDLLRLYAERMAAEGHAFAPDDPWQRELEDSFPYVETPDQERAIREVKEDMEKPVPMDRLVYGDVGFGKTEVAVRAAFKAVMDGKQVMVLVPTTVLAQQHYRTFTQRFHPFPVRVEVLSRFRTPREQREVLEAVARGEVDVIIGTHRLLQEDVSPADLGLLIVDEEHRFGVAQKEKMKALRRNVDVLTLTATPIPRTLQMSLSGIRDMSIMDTPIEDRRPVITSVGPYDEQVVQEAIRKELARGGQVFYVHNRVQSIERAARRVRELVPEARVLVGHGQMRESRLERVMDDFVAHRADVLVCTTIVESGLDIPNVNTLIVDGAEHLGLSQLYHLRGRIGRGDRQAYAFFLFHPGGKVTDGAAQRLKVIRDFSELGSGLRVAMKDLEIRGAGNLLGPEQHGHVEAVGFELYCRMLAEAVDELRGIRRPRGSKVTIDLPLRAFVPEEYIPRASRRLELYRRLGEAEGEGEVDSLAEEVRDRYGPLPVEVESLFASARLRLACLEAGVREVGHERDAITVRLSGRGPLAPGELLSAAEKGGYPWRRADFREGLREVVLSFPPGSRPGSEASHVESITRWLKEAVSVARKG